MPHAHPHPLWGRSRFPSALQSLLQPHIFALRHNTWGREPVWLQHGQEREAGFAQSWRDASWNLCSASQETFSACVKDGSSWGTYGIRFSEKVVVQPESVHRAASRLINNQLPASSMQNKRPQESDLVTKTKYFNDSETKGRPGVCCNNLTQLHFLLNHFSKQNTLQRYFIRGDDGIYVSHPIFCFASRKDSNNHLFSAGYWINCNPHSWPDLYQHCSPTPCWAIYTILQSDTHMKQHSGCNKTLLKQ